ncbi:MAG: hypothetical protein MZV49_09945 [Rhodopseudomonas palustris]|nr:hypothetical protein [Rhodopseudomonas palustris]
MIIVLWGGVTARVKPLLRHCEERSDEAVHARLDLDCSAALAMTGTHHVVARTTPLSSLGDRTMSKPDTPFPKHWLYYIAIKVVLLAGATALVLKLYGLW